MIHNIIKRLSYKLVKLTLNVDNSTDEYIINRFQLIYNLLANSIQLILLVIFALIFRNLDNFIIMLFVYMLVRSTGKALHFDNFDRCFWWTNAVFGTTILMMWVLIDFLHFDRSYVILFYSILNGLSLSNAQSQQLEKIRSMFAYEINEKTELKRKIDSYIVNNFDDDEVIAAIKSSEKLIGDDTLKIAYQRYKCGLSIERIATDNYSNVSTIKRKIQSIRIAVNAHMHK